MGQVNNGDDAPDIPKIVWLHRGKGAQPNPRLNCKGMRDIFTATPPMFATGCARGATRKLMKSKGILITEPASAPSNYRCQYDEYES